MENTLVPTRSVVHARQAKKSRAPQESIAHTFDSHRTCGVSPTAVSPVLLFWLEIQFFYSFDDQLVLCYNIENKNDKRKQWPRLDKSFHKMTRITSYNRARMEAQVVQSYELVRKY